MHLSQSTCSIAGASCTRHFKVLRVSADASKAAAIAAGVHARHEKGNHQQGSELESITVTLYQNPMYSLGRAVFGIHIAEVAVSFNVTSGSGSRINGYASAVNTETPS